MISVDLPAPLSPSSAVTSPARTSKSTSSSAETVPNRLPIRTIFTTLSLLPSAIFASLPHHSRRRMNEFNTAAPTIVRPTIVRKLSDEVNRTR